MAADPQVSEEAAEAKNSGAVTAAADNVVDGNKRKLEDDIQAAKQKAQELAARLVDNAESKRPRVDYSADPAPPSSIANPVFNYSYPAPSLAPVGQHNALQAMSKKICIPNGKVGVIIGKGGETIKYLQLQSGAKIQITRDSEADPYSLTRDVELMGTSEQISRAEQLINDVIAETEAGGSASAAVHGPNMAQPGVEQVVVKVPNNKVALLIGKGGDTIKAVQSRSGARVQVIPLHLPPGDTSTERNVYINGSKEQIESARELINEVLSGKRIVNPSVPNVYMQAVYTASGNWAPYVQSQLQQQTQYGYAQPGTYSIPPSYYSYSTSVTSWDSTNSSMSQPEQTSGYAYYEQQSQTGSDAPNPSYDYSQAPSVAGYSYDLNYSQQSVHYPQNSSGQISQVNSSGYEPVQTSSQTDGAVSSQSTQPQPAYPPAYSQPIDNPQVGYWTQNYPAQPLSQAGYDQLGYQQTVYGGLPHPSNDSFYGQTGYPPQPSLTASDYTAEATQAYGEQVQPQSQLQPPANGSSQPPAYGTEKADDGSSGQANDLDTASKETVQ